MLFYSIHYSNSTGCWISFHTAEYMVVFARVSPKEFDTRGCCSPRDAPLFALLCLAVVVAASSGRAFRDEDSNASKICHASSMFRMEIIVTYMDSKTIGVPLVTKRARRKGMVEKMNQITPT
mmetsp:Transcript_22206/g.35784  ORF Transcript_22206/g.35784 Transcript_22206/m.35784 type:complete len:122 (-) Transcript_22206:377-742(-)